MKANKYLSSFTVIVAFVAVSLAGLATLPYLTVKLSPSRTLPSLSVSFNMSGNSARIVEMEVTSKLEAMLGRINGVKSINSTSSNGYGSISLGIDKHASMDMVRLEASTIIRQAWSNLPTGTSYPTLHINRPDEESARPFIVYNLNAQVSPIIIQQYAEEHIKPILAQIPGIYKIDVTGATSMEWRLEYDVMQLDALGISVSDVRTAISNFDVKQALGMALSESEDGSKRYMRLTLATANESRHKAFHPEEIWLSDRSGRRLRLDQLVKVTYTESPPSSYFRINGLNSIYLSLTATEDANQLNLSKTVQEEMRLLKQTFPKGYELHINYNATERIDSELNKIYTRTILTVLILLFFVFITTFNAKYLLLIVISLFFNITIAFIFYYIAGLEIQMYSLAGITISLSLVIDNTIIMSDHYLRNRDRKAFLSILAATLTTVGALAMIYFLDEKIRLNLQDFASVVMINLLVSLAVSFFFVPAAIEKMGIKPNTFSKRVRFKRLVVYFNRAYYSMSRFLFRFRRYAVILLILGFGLPVFMLPDKLQREEGSKWKQYYNKVMNAQTFKEKVRPVINKALGGALRLFVQKTYSGSYFSRNNSELTLNITASMPNGTTMKQMNYKIQQMEAYLSQFKEIRQFQTSINGPRRASINVNFTEEAEHSGFPYQLKSNVITKALQLGGGSWGVYGLEDQGFSNDVRESAGQSQVKMYGYNYDDLWTYADTLKQRMLSYRRIKEVFINSQFSYYKDDYREYNFSLDRKRMAAENIQPYELYSSISPVFLRDVTCGYINGEEQVEPIRLSSIQSSEYDVWSLANMSRAVNGKYYKTREFATIEESQTPVNIVKENQQYVLCLQYEYIGSSSQSSRILERELKAYNEQLPLGYSAKTDQSYYSMWEQGDNKQYFLLAIIILIIFFMTAILFNSLKQPLAIIFVIPVSYIGVFLTFYLFRLNFDQGGFASFVLLCGITVNASIYLINEYNHILRRKPNIPILKAYIKSWNIKIVPIFLTIISTILGFIPFMVGTGGREGFWFPLAAGTIGGLIMSLIGIFIFLPLFLLKRKKVYKTLK